MTLINRCNNNCISWCIRQQFVKSVTEETRLACVVNRSCKHNSFPCDKRTTKPFQGNDADMKSCHFSQWRIRVFWWEKLPKTTEITPHLHYLNKYEYWVHLLYASGWEGNEPWALFSMLWYNDMLFWNGTHPLSPWEHGCSVTSVPGHKQQGHNPVEEFTASSMSIHPHQCPFLTVLLWSFFSPVILIYVCRLLEASYSERIQTRRTQDLFPLRLLLQAHRVPKHHKSPITTEQSYSGTFARGISGRLLSLICICWYVFPDPVIESFLFLSVSVVLLYYVSSLRSLRNPWALIFNLYKWEVTEAALEWEK